MIKSLLALITLIGLIVSYIPEIRTAVTAETTVWSTELSFGGTKNDYGRGIEKTADGGYIVVGYSRSFQTVADDIYLIKLDRAANVVWEKYLTTGWGYSVKQTTDNGYIVSGSIPSNSSVLRDICLIKTDNDGSIQWQKTYGAGWGYDVKQTNDGGFIVAGTIGISSSNTMDIRLLRTDSEGNQVWTKALGGTRNDGGYSVVSSFDGGFLVAGSTESYGSGSTDIYIVKVNANGNFLWQKAYGGRNADEAYYIDNTADGGYILTGSTASYGAGLTDLYVIKIDADGYVVWDKTFGGEYSDYGRCIHPTDDGGYFATGATDQTGSGNTDAYLVRMNSEGNLLWQTLFGGSRNDTGWAVQRTTYGGYIIAGTTDSIGYGLNDVYIVKTGMEPSISFTVPPIDTLTPYESNMTAAVAWITHYDSVEHGADYANAIAVDASGNVYVTGTCWRTETGRDFTTVKYDSDGNEVWVKSYNGTDNGDDYANDIAVDELGNVYVAGSSIGLSAANRTSYDYAVVKYLSCGNQSWVQRYNGSYDLNDYAVALALDSDSNIYVTGYSWANTTGYDYMTIQYSGNGTQMWVQRYNGAANGNDYAVDIAVDNPGNIWVTGQTNDTMSGNVTTIMYDHDGNQRWITHYDGPLKGDDSPQSITIDNSGGICVTGYTLTERIPPWHRLAYDYVTIKYDNVGNQLWASLYNGPDSRDDRATAVTVDASRNIYVTGYSQGAGDTRDYATIKYDARGNQLWVARYDGSAKGDDIVHDIVLDNEGYIYVTGHSWGGNETGFDYTTIKYDKDGNQLWVATYNGLRNAADIASSICADDSGNVFITGYSAGVGTDTDFTTIKFVQSADLIPTPTPTPEPVSNGTAGNTTESLPESTGNTTSPLSVILDLTTKSTAEGFIIEYTELATAARETVLEIYTGTTALAADGQRLEYVYVTPEVPPPPLPDLGIAGLAYNYGPEGATFDPPVVIDMLYNPDSLPDGFSENKLTIARYDEEKQEWIPLESKVDTEFHSVAAEISHFTVYAICSKDSFSSSSSFNMMLIIAPIIGVGVFIAFIFVMNAKGAKRLKELGVEGED